MSGAPVFISFAGTASGLVADALRDWMPKVVQTVEPFTSSADLLAGSDWWAEIGARLKTSKLGIICVTPDNLDRPWIYFEAGAIAMHFEATTGPRVIPYVIGMEGDRVVNPLRQYNWAEATKEGTRKLIRSVNEVAPSPVADINGTFERWWDDLAPQLATAIEAISTETPPEPSVPQMFKDILASTRSIARALDRFGSLVGESLSERSPSTNALASWIAVNEAFAATNLGDKGQLESLIAAYPPPQALSDAWQLRQIEAIRRTLESYDRNSEERAADDAAERAAEDRAEDAADRPAEDDS